MTKILPQKFNNKFQTWYSAQSRRDKRALMILIIFAATAIIYMSGGAIKDFRFNASKDYKQAKQNLALLKSFKTTPSGDNSTTDQIIKSTAQSNAITLDAMESGQGGNMNISIGRVPYNQFLTWLNELSTHGIVATKVSITRLPDSGYVSVNATLASVRG